MVQQGHGISSLSHLIIYTSACGKDIKRIPLNSKFSKNLLISNLFQN